MIKLLTFGELSPTTFISDNLPLQWRARLQPALNVLIVLVFKSSFKLFIDKSSEIKMFLKPIFFLIKLGNADSY